MDESNQLHVVARLGPVGRAITSELVDQGISARAIARHPVRGLAPTVEVVEADIADPDAVRRAMAGRSTSITPRMRPTIDGPMLPPLMEGMIEDAAGHRSPVVYADNLYAYGPVEGP